MDMQYTYSGTRNNGQITQSQDYVTGEQVNYTYDQLQRLIAAQTTGPQWGLTFSYDGFGNRLSQAATKGTAPTVYSSYDTANHIMNYIHDGNGNITWLPNGTTLAYDVENRVTTATVSGKTETYYYAPDGRRVYRKATDGTEYMYFYGVNGERLPYQMGSYVGQLTGTPPAYFAGRRLGWGATADRLGSVRVTAYYPYGEYEGTASGDDVRFATYVRDSATGLDYAMNRYYASIIGRFLSPDPYKRRIGADDPANPQSWNQYVYAEGDPVNFNDPAGANRVLVGMGGDCYFNGEYTSCTGVYGIADMGGFTGAADGHPGGGGSGSGWLVQYTRFLNKLRAQTQQALWDLSRQCKDALAAHGIRLNQIEVTASSTVYYNSLVQGAIEVRDITGYNNPLNPNQTLGEYLGSARAATLPNSTGTGAANYVVLGTSFFTKVAYGGSLAASQNITLVHEALHTGAGLGDLDLYNQLGFAPIDVANLTPVQVVQVAGGTISLWLAEGCPKQ
jgi:RHS repeat-associated protein